MWEKCRPWVPRASCSSKPLRTFQPRRFARSKKEKIFLPRVSADSILLGAALLAEDGRFFLYLSGAGKFADRETFPLPCLVLLDLKLPYVMGLDVLKWIRSQAGPPRVVVLLSASGEEADIAAAYRLGANAFLVKPTEARKFEELVRAIRDFWLVHNTPPPEVESAAVVLEPEKPRSAPIATRMTPPGYA